MRRGLLVGPGVVALLQLAGCGGCPTFAETVIRDPDDLVDDDVLISLEDTLAAFASWVELDGVCVDDITLVDRVEAAGHAMGGGYIPRTGTILLVAGGDDLPVTLAHELCHALDEQLGLSFLQPELFSDAWGEEIVLTDVYDTEDNRRAERFADLCQGGPHAPSITTALEPLGLADPADVFLRDWVFLAYEEPAVVLGEAADWQPVAQATLPYKGVRVLGHATTGGHLLLDVVETGADGTALRAHVVELEPTTGARVADLPLTLDATLTARFVPSLGEPAVIEARARSVSTSWYRDGALVGTGGPLGELLARGDTTVSLTGTEVWWQTWTDDEPLQRYDLATGRTEAYPVEESTSLYPPTIGLPEGLVAYGRLDDATSAQWVVLGEDAVTPLPLPVGIVPIGVLADGRVVGRASWSYADASCTGVAFREDDGSWILTSDACDEDLPSAVILGGELWGERVEATSVDMSRPGG